MKKSLVALLLVFVLIVSACSKENGTENKGGKAVEKSDSKTLVIAGGTDMTSFDIHNHNTTYTEAIHVNMFNYLVKNGGSEGFISDLAESWENVDDLTWSFKLKEGVKFHNGEELTAEDVKFSLERVAKDDTLLEHGSYKQIQEVKVKSAYEFDIITGAPDPTLLNRLSRLGSGVLPKNYIETEGWEGFLKNPIGTGPYKFKEWKRDDRVVLVANENYFGNAPKWEELIFRSIPEDSTRVSELLTGGVDIAVNIPPTDVERVGNTDGVSIVKSASQRVMMLVLRTAEGNVTADPKVREAIDLAIDKQAIVDSLLNGAGKVTRTRVTPGNVGANEDLYGKSLYDPAKAKELLAEAGYANGLELSLSSPNGRYLKDKETAELIQAMLSEVGISVKLEFLEWSAFQSKYAERSFGDMFFLGYGNSMFDASLALDRMKFDQAKGETDYNNPETEALLNAATSNMNPEERIEQYQKAQELIAEDRPQIYLFQVESIYGKNDRIDYAPRVDEMFYVDEITLK